MKEICRKLVDGDHNPPKGENKPTKFLMASSKNINNDSLVNLEDVRFLSEVVFKECDKRTKVSVGDIAITSVGTLGRSCIIENDYNLTFQRSVTVITLIIIHNYYVKYYLDSAFIQNFMYENAKGTAQQGFYINQMEELLIPLPPLAEQQRIVTEIERWFSVIDALEANEGDLLKTIDQAKKKILDLAIRGKLVPQDPNDKPAGELLKKLGVSSDNRPYENVPFDVPNGWVWTRLDSLCDIKGGKRIPKGMAFSEKPTKHIYIRVTNMKNHTIIDNEIKYIDEDVFQCIKNYTISASDLYLTIAGTIGDVGEVPQKYNGMNLTENAAKLTCINTNKTFLKFALLSSHVQDHFSNKFHQVAQPKLSIETASSALIPLPPLSEQQRIVAKIEELYKQLDAIATSLQA